jgi:hypothetical protein
VSSNINKEDIFCQTGRVHFSREDIMLVEKESSSTVAAAGAPYYIRVVTIDEVWRND